MRCGWIVLLLSVVVLSGCASQSAYNEMTEAQFYQQAHQEMVDGRYLSAIDEFKELKARFPYGDYAEQAQLELIYSYYQAADFANTIAAASQFLTDYPTSEQTDYALYLLGLGNYRLTQSLFGRVFDRDVAARDLSAKRDAFNNFAELVRRFPDSQFAPDARSRMLYIRRLLAQHNINVARYYARREAFIAAANRAKRVVQHYQGTPQVQDALAIQSRCYDALKLPKLAQKSARVLAYNWPNSHYLNDEGRVEIDWWPTGKSWLNLLTFDLL